MTITYDMLSEVDKAFIARLRGDATLISAVPGGVWEGEAPTESDTSTPVTAPYIVVRTPSGIDGGSAIGLFSTQFRYDTVLNHQDTGGVHRAAIARILELCHNKPLTLPAGLTNEGIWQDGRFRLRREGGWVEDVISFIITLSQDE